MAAATVSLRERLSPFFGKDFRYALWSPIIALAVVALLNQTTELITRLEYMSVNLRYLARAPFDRDADPRILYVGIDQHTVDQLGAWPWPRNIEADFLNFMAESGTPQTVAFDILFTEGYDKTNELDKMRQQAQAAAAPPATSPASASPFFSAAPPTLGGGAPTPAEKEPAISPFDQKMADAAGNLPSVITGAFSMPGMDNPEVETRAEQAMAKDLALPSLTSPYSHVTGDVMQIAGSNLAKLPIPVLRAQSLFGFVNDQPSHIDNIRHRLPIVMRIGEKVYPSLSLQVLCQLLNVDPDKVEVDVGHAVTLRNSSGQTWTIPINERGEIDINYRSNSSFKRSVEFSAFYAALYYHWHDHKPLPPICEIDHKAVMIGGAAIGLTDLGPTPLSSLTPLIYTHLNVVNNVLQHDYLTFVPDLYVVLGWLAVIWTTMFSLRSAHLALTVIVPFAVVIAYTAAAFGIFAFWSVQIDLAWPVLAYVAVDFGQIVHRWRQEQAGRREMKQLFARMLSPEVMGHMLDNPASLKLGGSTREVTILFSDIRDYTKFSEGIGNEELVRQLNIYFEEMVKCIMEEQGTCHKFIGDAIMAVWGDIPSTSNGVVDDAKNAVRSALKMRRRLRELNEARVKENLIPLRIGIGLNHGDVLAGQIGASVRSEWTVMGDAVNTASRLEGMTKTFHTDFAIGDSVRALIGEEFLVRRLGLIVLKGKTKPTVVWEVLTARSEPELSTWTAAAVAEYETAFDCFLQRRFAEAEAHFKTCLEAHPGDYCAENYLKAAQEFMVTPPPDDWDGRIVMTTK